jgi:uncharacterized protein with PIN domain
MVYRLAPHLAFLIQWLRILGVDVRLWEKERGLVGPDETVVQWQRYPLPPTPTEAGRITLSSPSKETLLKEFFDRAGLLPETKRLFTRCLRCNSPLTALNPEEARDRWPDLPPYVFQTQKRFNWCDRCRQMYWAGTHVQNMMRTLEQWGVIEKRVVENKK